MKVKISASEIWEASWYEHILRFVFGGMVTALTGLIAKRYGPEIGGLFLAFPAIFPAAATLIESEEKKKKAEVGSNGTMRGRLAAGADAAGAAMGSMGLVVFALIVWKMLPQSSLPLVLGAATLAWFVTALSVWFMREKLCRKLRKKLHSGGHSHRPVGNKPVSIHRRLDE